MTPKPYASDPAFGIGLALADFARPGATQGISCMPIGKIEIRGAKCLPATSIRQAVTPFERPCLGLPEFNARYRS
ncbi:hypothetical protein IT40_02625 [Paracoccus versutus]|nr:hypothetical protein IT40_02625 [Paracoccus versutus]